MKKILIASALSVLLCCCSDELKYTVAGLGQNASYPNAVVLNVESDDSDLTTEWIEDGKSMGALEKVGKGCYIAVPNQYAAAVTIKIDGKQVADIALSDYIDVQAHRGGAGIMPENTVEAMLHAIDMGVNTLELDLVLSGDSLVVVSHDSYFHPRYSIRPDSSLVMKEDPREWLYHMSYEDILKYDVGSRPTEVWPEKACMPAVKPLATDLIDKVEAYTKEKGLTPVRYNIEVKSKDAEGEGTDWADYRYLSDACVEVLLSKQLGDRLVVQCFDHRALNYMHSKYPDLNYSYLVGAEGTDVEACLALLDFTPKWLSPHYSITDENLVRLCREKGMRIVPWTVDEAEDIKRMIELDVDAIISNYPDRVLDQTR